MAGKNEYFIRPGDVEPLELRDGGWSKGWKRMDARLLVSERNGSEFCCFFRVIFPPGARHERHLHADAEEVYWLLRGRGIHGVGDQRFEAGSGGVIFVPKNTPHWLINPSQDEEIELVAAYVGAPSIEKSGIRWLGPVEE